MAVGINIHGGDDLVYITDDAGVILRVDNNNVVTWGDDGYKRLNEVGYRDKLARAVAAIRIHSTEEWAKEMMGLTASDLPPVVLIFNTPDGPVCSTVLHPEGQARLEAFIKMDETRRTELGVDTEFIQSGKALLEYLLPTFIMVAMEGRPGDGN